jgi:hypothetical protein
MNWNIEDDIVGSAEHNCPTDLAKKHFLKYSSLSFATLSKPSKLFRRIAVVCLFLTLSLLLTLTLWTELVSAVGEFAQTVVTLRLRILTNPSRIHSKQWKHWRSSSARQKTELESAQARADQATLFKLSTADDNSVRVSVMNTGFIRCHGR